MPLFNNLTQAQQDRVVDEIELKMKALEIADRKLWKRLTTVPNLTNSEIISIKLESTRIGLKIDILDDRLDAIELNKVSIGPPSQEKLEEMKQKVDAIRKIIVADKTAKAIVNAAVAVSGSLPKKNLT